VVTRSIVVGLASDHAWTMAEGLRHAGSPLAAVVESDPRLQKRAREIFGQIDVFATVEQVPDAEHYDVALITTDNAAKPAAIGWAIARGIPVYADKPLAASGDDATAVAAATETGAVPVMVAFHTVFDGVHDEAKSILASGGVGDVYFVRGIAGHAGLKEAGVSNEFTAWLVDPVRGGGGTFIDQAVYLLNTFMDQLGTGITDVTGISQNLGLREYIPDEVEDVSAALLRFANGAIGVLDTKWAQIGRSPLRLAYHGTQGTLTDFGGHWLLQTRVKFAVPAEWALIDTEGDLRTYRRETPPSRGYVTEAQHLLHVVSSGTDLHPAVTAEAGARVQRVVDAFYESVRTGSAVSVASGA
jgi:predicted dehydrogenase